MKTKYNIVFLPALLCLLGLSSLPAANRTWINAGGGAFVGPTTNWAGGTIAGTGDVVLFDATGAPATYTVTLADNYTYQGLRNLAGDSVTVDLDGRTLTLTASTALYSRGTLNFENGTLTASHGSSQLNFGREGTATSTLTGVTANTATFLVGVAGISDVNSSNSHVTVDGGTTVTASGAVSIGGVTGNSVSNNSTLTVKGAGTEFSATSGSGAYRVGASLGTTGNRLEVLEGATVVGTGAVNVGAAFIGNSHNSVLVDGTDSHLQVAGMLIGYFQGNDANLNNEVKVRNNGTLSSSAAINVHGTAVASNNRLVIESGGTVQSTALDVRSGIVEVDGGSLTTTGNVGLLNGSQLTLLDGEITIGSLSTTGAGNRFVFDLTGDTPGTFTSVEVLGNISVAPGNLVDILGVSQAGSYTLFTYAGTSNADGRFSLGDTPGGFEVSLIVDDDSQQILLNVTAIPEPSTSILLTIGLMTVMLRSRRISRLRA